MLKLKMKTRELDEYVVRTVRALEVLDQATIKDGQMVDTPVSETTLCVALTALRSYVTDMLNTAVDLYDIVAAMEKEGLV